MCEESTRLLRFAFRFLNKQQFYAQVKVCKFAYLSVSKVLKFLGTLKGDAFKALACSQVKELREICNVEQIRTSTNMKRSICRRCRLVLVPDRFDAPTLAATRRGHRLIRRCLNCDTRVSYVCNPAYLARSERPAAPAELQPAENLSEEKSPPNKPSE